MRLEDGILQNARYHKMRVERTIRNYYHRNLPPELNDLGFFIDDAGLPDAYRIGRVKCRMLYDFADSIPSYKFEYTHYHKRVVSSLRLVEGSPDYCFKYTDRRVINHLFDKRDGCDDIIIVKNGLLTDASAANIAIVKDNRWFTPSKPLLKGTERARLIKEGKLYEADIRASELYDFDAVVLINAMCPFEEGIQIPLSSVKGLK